jgi:pimeloyl-ACP methyl ester carboxylesterase
MPPARTVWVRGHGELFLRDTGGDGPPVMLLHGWMASADLNWWAVYDAVRDAGYRVLAIDHRGHGRGLRPLTPFRLVDCAADAAAALRAVEAVPALVVGYSMGGAIAQLVARDHPDVVRGLVLSATAQHWQDPRTRRAFKTMGALGLTLSVAPRTSWRAGLRQLGLPPGRHTAWVQSELMRQSARDMAEAGRELGRFDSRAWLGSIASPVAVVLTTRDELVPPDKQLALARAANATVFEAPIKHLEIGWLPQEYSPPLLQGLKAVGERQKVRAA